MKSLMILGAGTMQVPIIEKCKTMGVRTLVADQDPAAVGLGLADHPLIISTNDIPGILAAARKNAIDGILTTSDFPVRTVAAVAAEMGLPGVAMTAAEICTDKFLQREALGRAGLPMPQHLLLGPEDPISPLSFAFPVIVKPVDSSASRGVRRVDHAEQLPLAVQFARANGRCGRIVIEEWVEGPEFSVEVLIQHKIAHIIAITAKTTAGDGGAYFVETRHVVPAGISAGEECAIRQTVSMAVLAVGLDYCASHVELKLSKAGPVIIEMAARLGGDYITSDLVPLATGVDMLGNVICMALGEPIDAIQKWHRCAGIQFVVPGNHAAMADRIPTLLRDPRVVRTEIKSMPEGAVLRNSMDRLGYTIAVADSLMELENLLQAP